MELYKLTNDIHVLGLHVGNFPVGISEAIDKIHTSFLNDKYLPLYSKSRLIGGKIEYLIGVDISQLEVFEISGFEQFVIESGNYWTQNIKDWQGKVQSIPQVFDELLKDHRLDANGYCVEWYRNVDELICMVKLDSKLL